MLCNGENGTPDLRGRFVLGASETHALGSTGGEEKHVLTTGEMPKHKHAIATKIDARGTGNTNAAVTRPNNTEILLNSDYEIQYAGSSYAHNNMPPYYTLCYIMKV